MSEEKELKEKRRRRKKLGVLYVSDMKIRKKKNTVRSCAVRLVVNNKSKPRKARKLQARLTVLPASEGTSRKFQERTVILNVHFLVNLKNFQEKIGSILQREWNL